MNSFPLSSRLMASTRSALFRVCSLFMLIALLLGSACRPQAPAGNGAGETTIPTETAEPTPLLTVVDDGRPLAPQVVAVSPEPGQELSLEGEIRISFDQPMAKETTASALAVSGPDAAAVKGEVSWEGEQTLNFRPAQPLKSGAVYQVRLGENAASAAGVTLREAYASSFNAVGNLAVARQFPADGVQDVAVDSTITVLFNRPVVPLVIAEDQGDLPVPIQIEPEVSGAGEWVNTSTFTFYPDRPLAAGTTYTIEVPAGLTDAAGESTLTEGTRWQFTTQAPLIDSYELLPDQVNPPAGTEKVRLDAAFAVNFLQPMDPDHTERALSLVSDAGEPVELERQWNEEFTRLVITPTQQLALGTQYHLVVAESAEAASGGTLAQGLDWPFTTVPPPAILSTEPLNGATQAEFTPYISVHFASPMRIDTVKSRIEISPAPEEPVEWWYDIWSFSLNAFFLKPSTTYTLRFQAGMEDIYGNPITQEQTVRFTTAPRSPQVSLQMPYMPVLFRAGEAEAQSFYLRYVNIPGYRLRLFSLPPEVFSKLASGELSQWEYSPSLTDLVWEEQGSGSGAQNEWVLERFTPTFHNEGLLPPGYYFLGATFSDNPEGERYLDTRLVLVASANLTLKTGPDQAVMWLTDLASGEPVEGAELGVYDSNFRELGIGSTDADGLLAIDIPYQAESRSVFAMTTDPEAETLAFAANNWDNGTPTYEFGIYGPYFTPPNQPRAYVYTERPIYRPGQPVYFKGIVRVDDDLDYHLPGQTEVVVSIEDFQETVYQETLSLSGFATFNGEFALDSEAALGSYSILVRFPGSDDVLGAVTFTVAEYRRPEFQVNVTADPQDVLGGGEFTGQVSAAYYSGGAVANAEVAWTLSAEPYIFDPGDDFAGYSFTDYDDDLYYRDDYFNGPPSPEVIASGTEVTGEDGSVSLTLPADLSDTRTGRQLTFEASITDISQNVVSNRAGVTVHPAQVYGGVRPASYIGSSGDEQAFDLAAVDWDARPVAGLPLDVEIVERRWYSIQEQDAAGNITWTSSVEEIPVESFEGIVTGEDGKASITFVPPAGGVYKARVTARDEHGNAAHASAYMWVAGEDYIPWRQTDDHSFDLVSDRDSYMPGDTAQLLIASPFQGPVYALISVERGKVRQQEVVLLETNSTVYELPITPDMAPNIYVSVLVVKGVDETNPRPAFKMGFGELKVSPDTQELQVEIVPDQETAGPGDMIAYTIFTRDNQGNPVSAELSLGLSDLATLSLMDANSAPILDYFYGDRSLNVWTSVPLVLSIEDYNADIQENIPPEGGGMGSGGGKGSGEFGVVEVRQDFPDTAFWGAEVVTNENGQAVVSITLPDNLTTWRMDARAVTKDTRVGQSTSDLVSSRPLLVRPQTPRFLVVGDQVTIGAAVHNNTDETFSVDVSLEAEGLALSGDPVQTVEIAARQQAYLTWDVTVDQQVERVDLLFRADGGGYQDASRPTAGTLPGQGLPVYRYEAFETVATSGQVGPADTEIEAIRLPEGWETNQGTLDIAISPSLAAGVTDGLTYLENYPYECVEQTVSRFLPNVISTQALHAAGIADEKLEAQLAEQVNQALQRLYNWQNPDGGWGWWPRSMAQNEKSDALTTAYVLLGLIEAQQTGYTVNQDVVDRTVVYLSGQVRPMAQLEEPHEANRQMFILYILARAGAPDVSKTVQLYEQRQTLSTYALGYLAQTLSLIDGEDPRLDTLLSDLASTAIVSATGTHWEEETADPWNWNTDTRTTAIVLSALSNLDPENDLNANAVRWLMAHRTEGHWSGTQETAWTLMALTKWMSASGELNANFTWGVGLNGETIASGTANSDTLRQTQTLQVDVAQLLSGEANRLAFAHDEGAGTLYYTAALDLALPVDGIQALDRGMLVSRSYYPESTLEAEERFTDPITDAGQGDLVLVRLTLVAPHDLHYVVVDDPLPAGLEAVDQSLKTSIQTSVPQDYRWEDMFSEGWGWWYFDHIQLKDEKLILSAEYLPAGTYVYTYLARAATPGAFQVIPPTAQEFYFPEVYGRGEGSVFVIHP